MKKFISIEVEALSELFDFCYQAGFKSASDVLFNLRSTSGLVPEMKQRLIDELLLKVSKTK